MILLVRGGAWALALEENVNVVCRRYCPDLWNIQQRGRDVAPEEGAEGHCLPALCQAWATRGVQPSPEHPQVFLLP